MNHVQVWNPLTDRWVKLDTRTGRIVGTSPRPFKGVPERGKPPTFTPDADMR